MVEGGSTGVRVYREPTIGGMDYEGAFSVKYKIETEPNSAISGVDFIGKAGSLSFASRENMKIINIDTLDDNIHEESEFFKVTLYDLQNMPCINENILYKNPYHVLITDDDEPICPSNNVADQFNICLNPDLTGVNNSSKGTRRYQQLPNATWGTGYISTGLAYTGGAYTYGQTGLF